MAVVGCAAASCPSLHCLPRRPTIMMMELLTVFTDAALNPPA